MVVYSAVYSASVVLVAISYCILPAHMTVQPACLGGNFKWCGCIVSINQGCAGGQYSGGGGGVGIRVGDGLIKACQGSGYV